MRKEELPPDVLLDRDAFVALFAHEGWRIAREEALFQAGADVHPEAAADRRAGVFRQRVWYDATDRTVGWHFEDDSDLRFVLHLRPTSIAHVAAALFAAQGLLEKNQVGSAVRTATLGAEVFVQTPDGPVRVAPLKLRG